MGGALVSMGGSGILKKERLMVMTGMEGGPKKALALNLGIGSGSNLDKIQYFFQKIILIKI